MVPGQRSEDARCPLFSGPAPLGWIAACRMPLEQRLPLASGVRCALSLFLYYFRQRQLRPPSSALQPWSRGRLRSDRGAWSSDMGDPTPKARKLYLALQSATMGGVLSPLCHGGSVLGSQASTPT